MSLKNGESYTIMINISVVEDSYQEKLVLIPGFTFYDVNYDGWFYPDDIIEENDDDDSDNNYCLGLKVRKLFISLIILFLNIN